MQQYQLSTSIILLLALIVLYSASSLACYFASINIIFKLLLFVVLWCFFIKNLYNHLLMATLVQDGDKYYLISKKNKRYGGRLVAKKIIKTPLAIIIPVKIRGKECSPILIMRDSMKEEDYRKFLYYLHLS